MKRLRLAVVGFGKLGRCCCEALNAAYDVTLAGIVLRPQGLGESIPAMFPGVPVVSSVEELPSLDGALLCLPTERITETAHLLLQHGIPIVECGNFAGDAFHAHKDRLHRIAVRHHVAGVIGAGWDPGAVSLFHDLFALLIPKGRTQVTNRPGLSLHHTLTARSVPGVHDALCTEIRAATGQMQRYVYVELEPGADPERVTATICSEPLFLDEETLVFPVESVDVLEAEGRGVVLERRGTTGQTGHQMLMLEARFDLPALAGQVMVAAARALPDLPPGAHELRDVPLSHLLGRSRQRPR